MSTKKRLGLISSRLKKHGELRIEQTDVRSNDQWNQRVLKQRQLGVLMVAASEVLVTVQEREDDHFISSFWQRKLSRQAVLDQDTGESTTGMVAVQRGALATALLHPNIPEHQGVPASVELIRLGQRMMQIELFCGEDWHNSMLEASGFSPRNFYFPIKANLTVAKRHSGPHQQFTKLESVWRIDFEPL